MSMLPYVANPDSSGPGPAGKAAGGGGGKRRPSLLRRSRSQDTTNPGVAAADGGGNIFGPAGIASIATSPSVTRPTRRASSVMGGSGPLISNMAAVSGGGASNSNSNSRASSNSPSTLRRVRTDGEQQQKLSPRTMRRNRTTGNATAGRNGAKPAKKPSLLFDYSRAGGGGGQDTSSSSPNNLNAAIGWRRNHNNKLSKEEEETELTNSPTAGKGGGSILFDLPARKYPKEKPTPGVALDMSLLSDTSASENTLDTSGQSVEEMIQFRVRNPNSVAAAVAPPPPPISKPTILPESQLMMGPNHRALHAIEESCEGEQSTTVTRESCSTQTTLTTTATPATVVEEASEHSVGTCGSASIHLFSNHSHNTTQGGGQNSNHKSSASNVSYNPYHQQYAKTYGNSKSGGGGGSESLLGKSPAYLDDSVNSFAESLTDGFGGGMMDETHPTNNTTTAAAAVDRDSMSISQASEMSASVNSTTMMNSSNHSQSSASKNTVRFSLAPDVAGPGGVGGSLLGPAPRSSIASELSTSIAGGSILFNQSQTNQQSFLHRDSEVTASSLSLARLSESASSATHRFSDLSTATGTSYNNASSSLASLPGHRFSDVSALTEATGAPAHKSLLKDNSHNSSNSTTNNSTNPMVKPRNSSITLPPLQQMPEEETEDGAVSCDKKQQPPKPPPASRSVTTSGEHDQQGTTTTPPHSPKNNRRATSPPTSFSPTNNNHNSSSNRHHQQRHSCMDGSPPNSPTNNNHHNAAKDGSMSASSRLHSQPSNRFLQAAENALSAEPPTRSSRRHHHRRSTTSSTTTSGTEASKPGLRRSHTTADADTKIPGGFGGMEASGRTRNVRRARSMEDDEIITTGGGRGSMADESVRTRNMRRSRSAEEPDDFTSMDHSNTNNMYPVRGRMTPRRSKSSDGSMPGQLGRMRRAGRRHNNNNNNATSGGDGEKEWERNLPTRTKSSDGMIMPTTRGRVMRRPSDKQDSHDGGGRGTTIPSTGGGGGDRMSESSRRHGVRRSRSNVAEAHDKHHNKESRSLSPSRRPNAHKDHNQGFGAHHPSMFNSSRIKRFNKEDVEKMGLSSTNFGGHELRKLMQSHSAGLSMG